MSDAFWKEDLVQKAADYEDKILYEIDPVTVELSTEKFKSLLSGVDMNEGQEIDVRELMSGTSAMLISLNSTARWRTFGLIPW